MKSIISFIIAAVIVFLLSLVAKNASLEIIAQCTLYAIFGSMLLFGIFKVVDFITPVDIYKEITEKNNVSLAIVVASFVLGIAYIVSTAIS